MKTAGRENPNQGAAVPRNRAHGAEGQNRSCSINWAAKQEKFGPREMCFFLTSPFIELIGTWPRVLPLLIKHGSQRSARSNRRQQLMCYAIRGCVMPSRPVCARVRRVLVQQAEQISSILSFS